MVLIYVEGTALRVLTLESRQGDAYWDYRATADLIGGDLADMPDAMERVLDGDFAFMPARRDALQIGEIQILPFR